MKIAGQGALVTGASRGLGKALAEELAARGARVVAVARDAQRLGEVVAGIRRAGGEAHAVVADIADRAATHRIAGQAHGLVGDIAIAIHNASTLGPTPLRLLLDTECEDLASVLETNLVGPFRLTKILAGAMALRGSGVLVHISSDAAVSRRSHQRVARPRRVALRAAVRVREARPARAGDRHRSGARAVESRARRCLSDPVK